MPTEPDFNLHDVTFSVPGLRSHRTRPSLPLHAAGLLSFAATFLWLPHTTNPLHRGVGGPFQFLTVIALSLSAVVFALGLAADIKRSSSSSTTLSSLKTGLSAMCATPLALLVGVLYWSSRAGRCGALGSARARGAVRAGLGASRGAGRGVDVGLDAAEPSPVEHERQGLEKMSKSDMSITCLASACLMAGNTAVLKYLYRQVNK
ncbi:FAR-17a/AIG1-like protein [Apiospora aurea]|uniref:FAR-17a/AIG1-like protein n=1 Tax=Apiospora aurea TaxID=335848 RepID=A0ABR1Q221_9PEZI